jgi:1-acyl-sn-glycerol-3-phosphate acyltransferase
MTRFFLSVYDWFSRRRGLLFALLAMFVAVLAVLASRIRFKEDIAHFLPVNGENERMVRAYRHVAASNTVTVYCGFKESVNPLSDAEVDVQTAAIDALAGRLQRRMDSSFVKGLFYRVDQEMLSEVSNFIAANMPYFLDEADYERMDSLLTRRAIAERLRADKLLLGSVAGMMVRDLLRHDPLMLTEGVMRRLQRFSPGGDGGDGGVFLCDDHLFNRENQALLFIECALPASETARNGVFLDSLKAFAGETEREFDGAVAFDCFGTAEIGLANARQIRRDTLLSLSLAGVAALALLICAFRSGGMVLLTFVTALFGGLFALAMLGVVCREASIIAVGISSVMIGIAMNYPLHFMVHLRRVEGGARRVVRDVAEPLTIGNVTTVGAFLSLVFVGSEAMRDLGLFAALLLVGAILFVLLILPHLLSEAPGGAGRGAKDGDREAGFFGRRGWGAAAGAVVLLTVFFGFFCGEARFETDLRTINCMTAAQQAAFERMMGALNGNRHVMYFVTEGGDADEALEANERCRPRLEALVKEGRIRNIGSVEGFLPSRARQEERLRRWEEFWRTRRDSVMGCLREEACREGFRAEAFGEFEEALCRRWEVQEAGGAFFGPLREAMAGNYLVEREGKTMVVNLLYVDDAAKARELEEELNGERGSEERSVALDAGSVTRRMVEVLSGQFNRVLWVCGCIVFVFLLFSLGRLELTLIAFLPLMVSWIWILGLMSLFDLHFNIVNVILATFIFGQGDDYTIFMTEGLMHEYAYGRRILGSYGRSILLSALIMFVGMGALIFAGHPALRSLGEVTVTGMFSVVATACVIPPLLFRLLTARVRGGLRRAPLTLRGMLASAYALLFFLIASAVLTAIGGGMFACGRISEEGKLRYHRLLQRVAKFVCFHIPGVRMRFRNLPGERFDKPGILVCNHQSHLDLMCVMMLTPKLIVLTNDRAWHSPVYGRMIRYADFLPVSEGIERVTERLRAAVERGYSVAVFPEGSRSEDCRIRRFHRGAFYLAERLGTDLIPVLIHGAGHVLPKGEWMLRRGRMHVEVLPRIAPDDGRFRSAYSLRCVDVRHYFQAGYARLCRELETPDYYASAVIGNYLYKGASIERHVRRSLRRSRNFNAAIAALPDTGAITIRNTGYGEFALLSALVKKDLQITAVEPDADRRLLAANCVSVPPNLKYLASVPPPLRVLSGF